MKSFSAFYNNQQTQSKEDKANLRAILKEANFEYYKIKGDRFTNELYVVSEENTLSVKTHEQEKKLEHLLRNNSLSKITKLIPKEDLI